MQGSIVAMLNIGETLIPCVRVLGIIHVQDIMIILFMTSVWPSFWGWKVMDLVSWVSSSDQRLHQNVLRNRLSQYETMVYRTPKCTQTCSKKILAMASIVMLFLQVAIIVILEK
jgi:hypothetical protein